jgi:hypothetical protein
MLECGGDIFEIFGDVLENSGGTNKITLHLIMLMLIAEEVTCIKR